MFLVQVELYHSDMAGCTRCQDPRDWVSFVHALFPCAHTFPPSIFELFILFCRRCWRLFWYVFVMQSWRGFYVLVHHRIAVQLALFSVEMTRLSHFCGYISTCLAWASPSDSLSHLSHSFLLFSSSWPGLAYWSALFFCHFRVCTRGGKAVVLQLLCILEES